LSNLPHLPGFHGPIAPEENRLLTITSSKGSGSGTAATGSSATGGSTAGTETATGTGSGTAPQAETWARTEARARRVRLYDLPPGTQEGLLQQELEKIVPVKRVEVFQSRHEAQVELASQSVSVLF